jgi:flavin-dependent dehydrogenase
MQAEPGDEPATTDVDVLVTGLGPGGCMAALTAQRLGLSVLGVEARGRQGNRGRLVVVRPKAQALLSAMGLTDITRGRRTTTLRHVEERLRQTLCTAADAAQAVGGQRPTLLWHTRVAALESGPDRVQVVLEDDAGRQRTVRARHVVDATGGRLEALGRPPRRRTGARHIVVTAEYATPPWYDGIVGARDPDTGDAYFLIPMRGRNGITAYLDSPPGEGDSEAVLTQRFEAIAQRLGLRDLRQDVQAVDVVQRLLPAPSADRVVPIGDAAGTVDLWIGAGMSTAIEDGADAAQAIARAQHAGDPAAEMRLTREASARAVARHRSRIWMGRLVVAARPLIIRLWPTLPLDQVTRDALRSPRWLWQGIRVVFGRRPPAPAEGRD